MTMPMPWWLTGRRSDKKGYLFGTKGKLQEQDVFTWPFVILTKQGGSSWEIEVFPEPAGSPGRTDGVRFTFRGPLRDALAEAQRHNDEMTEAFLRRQRRRKARAQHEHDEIARRSGNKHKPVPMDQCPACQADRKAARDRRRKEGREG